MVIASSSCIRERLFACREATSWILCILLLNRLIMLKFGSSTSVLPFFRTAIALFSRRKRDSQWIYSSKSEEMTHANPGLITISILPSHPFDSTLRLHRAIQKAHIILASNKTSAQQFLKKLGEKQIQEEMNDSSVSIYSENEGNVVKYKEQRQGSIDQSL